MHFLTDQFSTFTHAQITLIIGSIQSNLVSSLLANTITVVGKGHYFNSYRRQKKIYIKQI